VINLNTSLGKVVTVSSVKGGVGKTTLTANLAGIYYLLKKKVLIIDLDLYAGGIATILNVDNKKDIYMLVDSISNNRFTSLRDYVCSYNNGIDVLAAPKDPRDVSKIESKYISKIINLAKTEYDVVLVDTHHLLDETTLVTLDACDMSAFIVTNDLVDLKNMKTLINIFNEAKKDNYRMVLNNSRDTGRDYISLFDVRNILKNNVDYTISRNFYIKNIDKYVLKGDILTLNKFINKAYSSDIKNMTKLALDLISEVGDGVKNNA
jgi:pilus assembly protein CpaE